MKNKSIINQLKKFDKDELARVTLTMKENALNEIRYHEGEWNKKKFLCESETTWRESELFTETMSVEDLIFLFEKKSIKELYDLDFNGLTIIETNFGDTDVENIEWRDPITESEEQELNPMDLYTFSETYEYQLEFGDNSIESIKIEIGDHFSTTVS